MTKRKLRAWDVVLVSALVGGALGTLGCAQSKSMFGGERGHVALTATPLNPSATGEISVSRDKENLKLDIDAKHLPRPQDLAPELSSYVVWLRPSGGETWTNAGALRLDQDRDASIEVRTPYRDVDVAITAERTPTPDRPSRYQVLEGKVSGAV